MNTLSFNWRLIRAQPALYAAQVLLRVLFLAAPVLPGLITQAVFDTISGARPAALDLWTLVALYVAVELARAALLYAETWIGLTFRFVLAAMLRRNVLASVLRRPGAVAQPVASGDAVDRLGTDVMEVTDFPTWLPEVLGEGIAAAVALALMLAISWQITLLVLLPMLAVVGLYRLVWSRIQGYNLASRQTSGAVAGFLGEVFGAVQAVQIAGAGPSVLARFRDLNDARRRAGVREELFRALLDSIYQLTMALGTGLILLLAGRAMAQGRFTVGDFALFVYYLNLTIGFLPTLGTFIGDYQQQAVSIDRLAELVAPEPAQALLGPPEAPVRGGGAPEPAGPLRAPARHDGALLEADGLTWRYGGAGGGVQDVSLRIRPGELVVVTGRVGSGKTTLLRALLGLLPRQAGQIRWRGQPVVDPAGFLVPPRSAYTPQVPRLFSETLRENLLLGLPEREADLAAALRTAVLDPDLETMPAGLDTLVGPRGVRLSGGQVQRAAAARALVRRPDLLVFDDLSSALDVETERLLWERLAARSNDQRPTTNDQGGFSMLNAQCSILAVSHRRAALARADRIIVLKDGRVEAEGPLERLLETCPELRRIWEGADDQTERSADHAV